MSPLLDHLRADVLPEGMTMTAHHRDRGTGTPADRSAVRSVVRSAVAPILWRAAGIGLEGAVALIGQFRPGRPFHPAGVWLAGTLTRFPGGGSGIAWIDEGGQDRVRARFSRGVGLPESWPDVLGLAVRCPGPAAGATDILLATTGRGRLTRYLLSPHRDVRQGFFSSMMPWRGRRGPILLAAASGARSRPLPAHRAAFTADLAREPWQLDLYWAAPLGAWRRFARLELSPDAEGDDRDRFDPLLNTPTGAGTYGWARRLREPGYARARSSPDGSARRR